MGLHTEKIKIFIILAQFDIIKTRTLLWVQLLDLRADLYLMAELIPT